MFLCFLCSKKSAVWVIYFPRNIDLPSDQPASFCAEGSRSGGHYAFSESTQRNRVRLSGDGDLESRTRSPTTDSRQQAKSAVRRPLTRQLHKANVPMKKAFDIRNLEFVESCTGLE